MGLLKTVSDSDAKVRLGILLDEVIRGEGPIAITHSDKGSAVLVAADEFAAIEETLHLLSTPANAERLRRGLADFAAGQLQNHDLCD